MKYKKYNLKVHLQDPNTGEEDVLEYAYLAKYYKSRPKILKEITEGLENIKNSNPKYDCLKYQITLSKCIESVTL